MFSSHYSHYGETKILIVDDEKLIRLTMSAKLRSVGYTPVAVATVNEAVSEYKTNRQTYRAIIADIMMGDMDGFAFRDIIRGFDSTIPIFFMTALDPEEGSGFLRRIIEDANSYYLPKSAKPNVVLRRIRSIVASRRVEQFIEGQMNEQKASLLLASKVQCSMLPARSIATPRGFYTTFWRPKDVVSGDLYEAMQYGDGTYLYVLGDIQGHGTSAALAMTAVQAFLKQFRRDTGVVQEGPCYVANMLQGFFRRHLGGVTYMTALICVHRPLQGCVEWISCGAPDLLVIDPEHSGKTEVNPEKRGGIPIGMLPDTVYNEEDTVKTSLSDSAVCVAFTDGILDLARDAANNEPLSMEFLEDCVRELIIASRKDGSMSVAPQKIVTLCEEAGYKYYSDDVTLLFFGKRLPKDGIFEATLALRPEAIEKAAVELGQWCKNNGYDEGLIDRIQLIFEESLMNVHDHGIDPQDRLSAIASVRLRQMRDIAELTIWDAGTPPPSLQVAAGDSDVALELKNREFSGRGRGRLIVRTLCKGISRSRYQNLNETIYHIPVEFTLGGEE